MVYVDGVGRASARSTGDEELATDGYTVTPVGFGQCTVATGSGKPVTTEGKVNTNTCLSACTRTLKKDCRGFDWDANLCQIYDQSITGSKKAPTSIQCFKIKAPEEKTPTTGKAAGGKGGKKKKGGKGGKGGSGKGASVGRTQVSVPTVGAPPPPPPAEDGNASKPSPSSDSPEAPTSYNISGAEGGAECVNGIWGLEGTKYNDKPSYTKEGASGTGLLWEDGNGTRHGNDWGYENLDPPNTAKWVIACGGGHRYSVDNDTSYPPTDGWQARSGHSSGTLILEPSDDGDKPASNSPSPSPPTPSPSSDSPPSPPTPSPSSDSPSDSPPTPSPSSDSPSDSPPTPSPSSDSPSP